MIYRQLTLSGYQCGPSGITLSLGLWLQYALSLSVASITLLSLRLPLSACFRFVEKYPYVFIAPLALCAAPSVLWLLHGYSGCHGFCYYGLPSDIGAEAMLFVPRLIVSIGITGMYVPVIWFLGRPDIGSAYLGDRSGSATPPPAASDTTIDAPWERLSFPNYDELTRSSKHLSMSSMSRERSSSTLSITMPPRRGHSRSETLPSEAALSTFTPPTPVPPRARPHTSAGPAPTFGARDPQVSFLAMLDEPTKPRTVSGRSRASTLVNPGTPRIDLGKDMLSPRERPRIPSVDSQVTAVEIDSRRRGSSSSDETIDTTMESMDSYMRRQTRMFLLWFPLTVGSCMGELTTACVVLRAGSVSRL